MLDADGPGQLQQPVRQRRLAVVDVGDDREVADAVHGGRLSMAGGASEVAQALRRRKSRQICSRLRDPEQGDRCGVDRGARLQGRPRSETIWPSEPSAERLIEHVPDAVAGRRECRRGGAYAGRCPYQAPKLEPAELAAQHDRLGEHAGGGRDHRRGDDPADAEGPVERQGGDAGDRQIDARDRGRDPGPLEAEEGPRQKQEEAVEGQREGEPEQRRGHQVGRRGVELARAGRRASPSAPRGPGSPPRPEPAGARSGACRWPSSPAGPRSRAAPRVEPGSERGPWSPPPRRCPAAACRYGTPCRSRRARSRTRGTPRCC